MKSAPTVPFERPSRSWAAGLAVVAAAAGLLSLVRTVAPVDWHAPETEIVLGGIHYRAGADDLGWLETFTAQHFAAGGEAARALVVDEIDAKLDGLFDEAHARLPEFLDWYYSLRGEYSRIAMAALEAADLSEPGYLAARAAATLFPEQTWASRLAALERDAADRLAAHYAGVREAWRGEVERRLAPRRVPAPLAADAARPRLVLDDFLAETVQRERQAFGTRMSFGAAAAGVGAVAAPALARAAAVRGGRAAAARTAARGASRVGAAAASGAAVCAPGGPVAAACAVLAGAGAWLVTDWALLRLDE